MSGELQKTLLSFIIRLHVTFLREELLHRSRRCGCVQRHQQMSESDEFLQTRLNARLIRT